MRTRLVAIEYDPAKADANQRKHGVSFADAEQALRDPDAATMEDTDAVGEPGFLTLGRMRIGACWLWFGRHAVTRCACCRHARQAGTRYRLMRSEYDFSHAKRGAVIPSPGKTRITIMLDNDVIETFRARAEREGRGYQTAINEALRASIQSDNTPVTVGTLRRELKRALKGSAA